MPITLSELARAAAQPHVELAKSLNEAKRANLRTVFLSHSHKDATYAAGVAALLLEAGFEAYIDWQDTSMPETPNHQTASAIKLRIQRADLFMFLATPSSTVSRWCPWEIGYADGVKDIEDMIVVQTTDSNGRHYGNEYLSPIVVWTCRLTVAWQSGRAATGRTASWRNRYDGRRGQVFGVRRCATWHTFDPSARSAPLPWLKSL